MIVFPRSCVWGMGFSGSSYICQTVMLAQCQGAGLGAERLLADDQDSPSDLSLVAAVATDDTMIFSLRGRSSSISAALALDAALSRNGVERHEGKDVDGVLDGVAIWGPVRSWKPDTK